MVGADSLPMRRAALTLALLVGINRLEIWLLSNADIFSIDLRKPLVGFGMLLFLIALTLLDNILLSRLPSCADKDRSGIVCESISVLFKDIPLCLLGNADAEDGGVVPVLAAILLTGEEHCVNRSFERGGEPVSISMPFPRVAGPMPSRLTFGLVTFALGLTCLGAISTFLHKITSSNPLRDMSGNTTLEAATTTAAEYLDNASDRLSIDFILP